MEVTYNKESVKGSPMKIKVDPGKVDAKNCKCYGRGIACGLLQSEAREGAEVIIETYDCNGNQCIRGGEEFSLGINGPNRFARQFESQDNGDG